MALHCNATSPFDLGEVEARLRAVTGPVTLGPNEPVDLQFSLGVVASDGPAELADLLRSADLAAYEGKTARGGRPPRTTTAADSLDAESR